MPSAPTELEAKVSILHWSTEEEPAEPSVSSIEVKSDDSLETQPILSETMTAPPPANDNVSIPVRILIPKETPETGKVKDGDDSQDAIECCKDEVTK